MLVHDLSHLGLLVVEDVGGEVEDDVQHAGLRGEGSTAVLRVWVSRDLRVGREGGRGRGEGEGRERGRGRGRGKRKKKARNYTCYLYAENKHTN